MKKNELKQFGIYLHDNPEIINLFKERAKFIRNIREYLDDKGAIELEMPCLQVYREGAPVHQFVTIHPLTGERFYLRHSNEDHLKRIADSFPMIYELGKEFRVENEDTSRLIEFTAMEFVGCEFDFINGIDFVLDLIKTSILNTFGTLQLFNLDFSAIQKFKFDDLMNKYLGYDSNDPDFKTKSFISLKKVNKHMNNDIPDWEIYEELLKYLLEPQLIQPIIITDFPLALQHNSEIAPNSNFAQRFSILANGIEICDGGIKINTSEKYKKIYQSNANFREKYLNIKDNEMPGEFFKDIDSHKAYIFSFGIGVDRLFAICKNKSIQEIVLFPFH